MHPPILKEGIEKMRFGIHTLDDYEFHGKTVLCRVDINQPVDRATDTLKSIVRITACIPTIRELSEKGAKVVLLAHQGSDIEYKNFYTTRPHAKVLSELLSKEVKFIEDVCGPTAREAIQSMQDGEIILLDNVRFCSEEQTLFELQLQLPHEKQAQTQVVSKLAPLADIYVCDAFAAAHRDQPTLCGFEQRLPSAMGRLFEREYCEISELMSSPKHPCTFVLGGSKISDAILMMDTVLSSGAADTILTGGLVGEIFLIARGAEVGSGTYSYIQKEGYMDYLDKVKEIYVRHGEKIVLPLDLAQVVDGKRTESRVGEIAADFNAVDIGTETARLYAKIIHESGTVFVNGPVGVFEHAASEFGTKSVFEALATTDAYTVIGGGDSVAAANKYAVSDKLNYVCTGGGALIRFLTGEELPVVKALRHAAEEFLL